MKTICTDPNIRQLDDVRGEHWDKNLNAWIFWWPDRKPEPEPEAPTERELRDQAWCSFCDHTARECECGLLG